MHIHSEKIKNPRKKNECESSATENHPLQGDAERRTKGEKRRVLQYDHALGRSHTFCCGRAEPVRSQQGWFGDTPRKGKYRATSGTVLGRLGLAWSCPYCASAWNFPQQFTETWPSWPPASGSGRGHRAPDCSAGCPRWGLTRCQGHSGWRTGCVPPPGSCDPRPHHEWHPQAPPSGSTPCGPWSTAARASQGARPGSAANSAASPPSGPSTGPHAAFAALPEAIAVLAGKTPRCSDAMLFWGIFPGAHRAQDQAALQLPPECVGEVGGEVLLLVGVRRHAGHIFHRELGLGGHSRWRYRLAALG